MTSPPGGGRELFGGRVTLRARREPTRTAGTESEQDAQARRFEKSIATLTWWMVLIVVAVAVTFAASVAEHAGTFFGVIGMSLVLAAASAVLGALLGFLFGIPKTVDADRQDGGTRPRYLANTNLEQISDWLTKILVGIGLVQIGRAGPAISRFGRGLAPGLGSAPGSQTYGLAICVLALTGSFLLAFLWTRTQLRRQLETADSDVELAVRKVVDAVASADALALSLVEQQLRGSEEPDPKELAARLAAASKPVLVQSYLRAEDQRASSWRNDAKRDEHARTIPVFRALIANDRERRYHRHFGSLGFALADIAPADLDGAIGNLTTAITIRGRAADHGFPFYEWVRAACVIEQRSTGAEADIAILADLATAAGEMPARFFESTATDDVRLNEISEYLARHELTYRGLRARSG